MGLASLDPPPKYSTDLLALRVAGRGIVPPTPDIWWGTAATGGAITWFHIDSNGLGVCFTLKCGLKILIFIKDGEGKFLVINSFEDFELDEAKGHQLEVFLLRPGTKAYASQSITIYCHCHSNLEKITGLCAPTLFMRLLHYYPPSVTESLFIAPPPC